MDGWISGTPYTHLYNQKITLPTDWTSIAEFEVWGGRLKQRANKLSNGYGTIGREHAETETVNKHASHVDQSVLIDPICRLIVPTCGPPQFATFSPLPSHPEVLQQ